MRWQTGGRTHRWMNGWTLHMRRWMRRKVWDITMIFSAGWAVSLQRRVRAPHPSSCLSVSLINLSCFTVASGLPFFSSLSRLELFSFSCLAVCLSVFRRGCGADERRGRGAQRSMRHTHTRMHTHTHCSFYMNTHSEFNLPNMDVCLHKETSFISVVHLCVNGGASQTDSRGWWEIWRQFHSNMVHYNRVTILQKSTCYTQTQHNSLVIALL